MSTKSDDELDLRVVKRTLIRLLARSCPLPLALHQPLIDWVLTGNREAWDKAKLTLEE